MKQQLDSPLKDWSVQLATWSDTTQVWQGDAASRLELICDLDCRWLAIAAQLLLYQPSEGVFLCFDTETTMVRVGLPMSLKGTINEVVAVPAGATKVWLQPLTKSGSFEVLSLTGQGLTGRQRLWRMLRRVGLYLLQTPAKDRARACISWQLACTDLAECYQRIGQLKACAPAMDYREWQQRFEQISDAECTVIAKEMPVLLSSQPLTVVLSGSVETAVQVWQRSVVSVEQSYGLTHEQAKKIRFVALSVNSGQRKVALESWDTELEFISMLPGELAAMLRSLPGQNHVLLLTAGSQLAPVALYWWLQHASNESAVSLIFSDHDEITSTGVRQNPKFKPDWSLELARSSHFIGDTLLIDSALLLSSEWLHSDVLSTVDTSFSLYGLVLRVAEQWEVAISHIPAVLWHQAEAHHSKPVAAELEAHLRRLAIKARVEKNVHGYLDIHYLVPEPTPLVSVIVPTKDMLHLLKPCVESVLNGTDYPAIELLIVDNQSSDPATLAYFNEIVQLPNVRVLTYDKPFNYSAINNFAVQQAEGELICLLNNDTEVIRPDWLQQMVGQLSQSDVGIVGARLLFADNRVQHAGDVLGVGGCATHLHFRLPADEPGYMGRAVVSQDVSAVTAACLLTRRALYLQLGGLNETDLTVAFNDVDYCLKVREAGWRVIYTPLAVLYHYESVSRGKDDNLIKQRRAQQEADYMRQRWAGLMQGDPFYNPNVNFTAADFRLSAAPRVEKPWKK